MWLQTAIYHQWRKINARDCSPHPAPPLDCSNKTEYTISTHTRLCLIKFSWSKTKINFHYRKIGELLLPHKGKEYTDFTRFWLKKFILLCWHPQWIEAEWMVKGFFLFVLLFLCFCLFVFVSWRAHTCFFEYSRKNMGFKNSRVLASNAVCSSYPFSSVLPYLHDLFSPVKRSRDQKFKGLISNVSFTNWPLNFNFLHLCGGTASTDGHAGTWICNRERHL